MQIWKSLCSIILRYKENIYIHPISSSYHMKDIGSGQRLCVDILNKIFIPQNSFDKRQMFHSNAAVLILDTVMNLYMPSTQFTVSALRIEVVPALSKKLNLVLHPLVWLCINQWSDLHGLWRTAVFFAHINPALCQGREQSNLSISIDVLIEL